MGRRCCVVNCLNSVGKPVGVVHLFPSLPASRKKWLESLEAHKKQDTNLENYGVRSIHFQDDDYISSQILADKTNRYRRSLRPNAVPVVPGDHANTETDSLQMMDVDQENMPPSVSGERNSVYTSKLEIELRATKRELSTKRKMLHKKEKLISQLRKTNSTLLEQLAKIQNDETLLNAVQSWLSPKQIQRMTRSDKHVHWSDEDMARSISLDSVSSKAYDYLRETIKYPLPSRSSIKRWLAQIQVKPGIITPVLNLLKYSFKDASPMERIGTIAFDEMAIDDRFCYDEKDDRICGGSDQMLGTFVRGTFGNWKQIVHYTFKEKFDQNKLFDIIRKTESAGIRICSILSDMGSKNQGLWKELGVGKVVKGEVQSTAFKNPCDDTRNIYVFPDYTHLLKLLRNHLIDSQLTLPDGTVVDKTLIQQLLDVQRNDLRLTFKVTQRHISVRGKERMKVRPAFELFSSRVANVIKLAFPKKKSEAEFFEFVNNFSDLMNTRTIPDSTSTLYKSPYGSRYEEQNRFLETFYEYFRKIKVGKRRPGTLAPFQKGFLIAIKSLIGLFLDMSKLVRAKYIMTSHLNQDYVENSFGILRGAGGFNMKPNEVEIMGRVKKLIVGKRFNQSPGVKCVSAEDQTFVSTASLKCLLSTQEGLGFPYRDNIMTDKLIEDIIDIDTIVSIEDVHLEDLSIYDRCEEGGREYVAGFIAKKLMYKYPELSKIPTDSCFPNSSWVKQLSEGGLTEPSGIWYSYFKKFDEYFEAFHPYGKANLNPDVVKRLANFLSTNFTEIPEKAIKLYAKVRTLIRVASINKAAENKKYIFQENRRNFKNHFVRMTSLQDTDEQECELHEEVENQACEEDLEELLDLLDPVENGQRVC